MKVYIYHNGLTFIGKAWEIKAKLKEMKKTDDYLQEFLNSNYSKFHRHSLPILSRIK